MSQEVFLSFKHFGVLSINSLGAYAAKMAWQPRNSAASKAK